MAQTDHVLQERSPVRRNVGGINHFFARAQKIYTATHFLPQFHYIFREFGAHAVSFGSIPEAHQRVRRQWFASIHAAITALRVICYRVAPEPMEAR